MLEGKVRTRVARARVMEPNRSHDNAKSQGFNAVQTYSSSCRSPMLGLNLWPHGDTGTQTSSFW